MLRRRQRAAAGGPMVNQLESAITSIRQRASASGGGIGLQGQNAAPTAGVRRGVSRLNVDRSMLSVAGSASTRLVLKATSTILEVTAQDVLSASLDPSRPLADVNRSEVATAVVRVSAVKAAELMRRLRALFELASEADGSGEEPVRLTLALLPVARELH